MAKYYSSTFGKISGKHGTAVAVLRKDGSTYLRIYKKPSNPRTDKQQAHRAKFALTSKSLVPFNPIFKKTLGITNGISTARSYAFKNTIVGEYPSLSMDYKKLMFSFGSLEKLQSPSVAFNDGVINLNWDYKKMCNCNADDSVSIVAFNKDDNQVIHIEDIACRSDKDSKIIIPDSWTKSELYLWAYVTSDDKKSDSVFVGRSSDKIMSRSFINEGVYSSQQDDSNTVDNKALTCEQNGSCDHITSNMHLSSFEVIANFIMILLNIISTFRQALVGSTIKNSAKAMIISMYNIAEHININNAIRRLVEAFWGKYTNISTPLFISPWKTIDKYRLNLNLSLENKTHPVPIPSFYNSAPTMC